jgi:LCP family protein required for cell wall assembly
MLLTVTTRWLRRHRKLLAWTGRSLAVLIVALAATGYLVYGHLNNNIAKANVLPDIGKQPADLHPQAENILIIGSSSGSAQGTAAGAAGVSNQSGTLMLVHIAANRQWAEIMSIPPYSWVSIPSCVTGDGRLSAPAQSRVNQAYATGDKDGNHVGLGAACTIKALEQDTGIYINDFIVMNSDGFKGMAAALGGVEERNTAVIDNPSAGLVLSPGSHLLTPAEALTFVHDVFGPGSSSNLARITLQEALAVDLIARARSEMFDPLATYRFLDAFTKSLTVDSRLGGITGLYSLEQTLHGIPAGKITLFALPSYPRANVVPSDTTDVLWTQPVDGAIFATFRNDIQASHALLATAGRPGKFGVSPSAMPGTSAGIPERTADQSIPVN